MAAMADWLSPCPTVEEVAEQIGSQFESVFGLIVERKTGFPDGLNG